jgi:hypothetical protein
MIYKILGFVILPALITAFFASLIPRKLKEREKFVEAASEFRNAFVEAQRLIDPNSLADRASAGSASNVIKDAINGHEIAMMKFEPFVSKYRLDEYKNAWKEYAENIAQYSGNSAIKQHEGCKLALSRINALLKFAKPNY